MRSVRDSLLNFFFFLFWWLRYVLSQIFSVHSLYERVWWYSASQLLHKLVTNIYKNIKTLALGVGAVWQRYIFGRNMYSHVVLIKRTTHRFIRIRNESIQSMHRRKKNTQPNQNTWTNEWWTTTITTPGNNEGEDREREREHDKHYCLLQSARNVI